MESNPSYRNVLQQAQAQLEPLAADNARLEAETLLCHVLKQPRSHLYTWPDRTLEAEAQAAFEQLLQGRLEGTPMAYLTGQREFWSLSLKVGPGVLVPRPETETLVELALERLPPSQSWRIADLGTGSGAIAAALASERPELKIFATDASATALEIARTNFQSLGFDQIQSLLGNWCEPLLGQPPFHLILSNPPYIAEGDYHLTHPDLQAEPIQALTSGPDGLGAIRQIAQCAPALLAPEGWLLMEHGFDQAEAVRAILSAKGFTQIRTFPDLGGRDRITGGQRPN